MNRYAQSLRETAHRLCIALLCVILSSGQVFAGSMTLLGVGKPAAAATYRGPGDVVSSWAQWGSCARVYNAANALTSTKLCDLVLNAAPTTVVCTLRGTTSGYVDLTLCFDGVTVPATACSGGCHVLNVYNQITATAEWTNVTAASQPTLTFSALHGLPAITCTAAASSLVAGTTTLTNAQPYTLTGVYNRTSGTAEGAIFASNSGNIVAIEAATGANLAGLDISGAAAMTAAATDAAFHSINALGSGASSVINIDGSETTGTAGSAAYSAEATRFCRGSGGAPPSLNGQVMEAGVLLATTTLTQRNALSANQHSATSGYNF